MFRILIDNLVNGTISVKKKSIEILSNELDRWNKYVFENKYFVSVGEVD